MIVGARMKARQDHEITIGWQVEKFAREGKKMQSKTLGDYLKPAPTITDKRTKGADDVRRMFERLAAKG